MEDEEEPTETDSPERRERMRKLHEEEVSSKEAEAKEILLGVGVLNWNRGERITDRYGTVHLFLNADDLCEEFVPLHNKVKKGEYGQLVVVVKETRKSSHIGDFFRGIFPTTPKVNDRFVLGTGTVFYDEDEAIGLEPQDNRETDWLDPRILYQVHEQTVELYFQPLSTN